MLALVDWNFVRWDVVFLWQKKFEIGDVLLSVATHELVEWRDVWSAIFSPISSIGRRALDLITVGGVGRFGMQILTGSAILAKTFVEKVADLLGAVIYER